MNRYISAVNLNPKKRSNYLVIFLLMLAGESIFLLPFVIARIFRPTVLTALELDNTQLGNCFSIYGICALFSYFLGGFITDLVAPRKLMALALLLTALGGFYMATYPNYTGMLVLYGYWGVTTILLFWAAVIKATRIWGKEDGQGKAFGFLEAGRGLVAASIGLIGALLFSYLLIEGSENQTLLDIRGAYKTVVLFASSFVVFVAFLVYFLLRLDATDVISETEEKNPLSHYWEVLKKPSVLLLMLIIL
ncbi:MAG: MFS transporter, partial [Flavobacteriaceae bacterium]|nr:MFS transporter [Flavobacteriaceae bacterium]